MHAIAVRVPLESLVVAVPLAGEDDAPGARGRGDHPDPTLGVAGGHDGHPGRHPAGVADLGDHDALQPLAADLQRLVGRGAGLDRVLGLGGGYPQ
jgi:hypothetical protein